MNVAFTLGSKAKENVLADLINISSDQFKLLLMRSGFQFQSALHVKQANVHATTGAVSLYVSSVTKRITRKDAGSFIDDGFVRGNIIGISAGPNNGVYKVDLVSSSFMSISWVSGTAITSDGSDGAPVTRTVTADDEMPTDATYTNNASGSGGLAVGLTVSGTTITLDEFDWADFGAQLADSPGALLISETSTDNLVVGYLTFNQIQLFSI